jgi:histone H3/H4
MAKKKAATKKPAPKKKAAAKKAAPKKGGAKEMLLVGSKTKVALKAHGVNVGGDVLDALNEVVHWYLQQAAARAGANGRKTVRSHDFMAG